MKRFVCISFFLLLAGMIQAQFRVTDLRVEHMKNPSVVDEQRPRLSWVNEVLKPGVRNQEQTAYQIIVATSKENLKAGIYDVWNTGKCVSNESNLVKFGGATLKSGVDYYWQVRTWNQDDKPSAWSEVGQWGMGLKNEEWTASWIGSTQDDSGAPLLRKSFGIHGAIKQAKVFICGLGFFELFVNGERIGDDYLVPNLSHYSKRYDLDKSPISLDNNFRDYRCLYMAYDVTSQLQEGTNRMGVMLGNGFYHPDKSITSDYGKPCLRCQMVIAYADGKTETVVSDGTWETRPSAILYNGIYKGELYDANKETSDWAKADAGADGWTKASVVDGPTGQMTAMTSPADKITETLKPVSLKKTGDKTWEVAFCKEISGWIHFTGVEGQKGDTLRVDYECESPQGIQQYVFNGNGKEEYQPHFTWFVFSKAKIQGVENLTEENLLAEAVNTNVPVTSEFETSNPLFNKINEIWQRSQMDNMHGCIASDCPHRERLPYTGDGQAACETVMLNFDAAAFYQKWIRDMRDSQNRETGYVPNGAPWAPACGGGVAWGSAMTSMPWEYYLQYGDKRMLEDSYFSMKEQVRNMMRWITLDGTMLQKMRNYGRDDECYWLNLGDWCPPGELAADELVHTFYLWMCCDYCARAARVMEKEDEATSYQAMADKVADNFHRRFYDKDKKSYGVAGSNIFALRMGVPESCRQEVINTLRKEIMEDCKGHINVGFVGAKFFFEVLSDVGLTDVACTVLNQKDFPSFGWWIEQGATTTWEYWDGSHSHNHPMFGSGLTWFCRRLAGIRTDESQPGYRHIIFRPCLTDMEHVRYALQTPYGKAVSEITQKDGKREMKVTVPVGSTATVYLPAQGEIRESNKALDKVAGITLVSQQGGVSELQLQQGTYQIAF